MIQEHLRLPSGKSHHWFTLLNIVYPCGPQVSPSTCNLGLTLKIRTQLWKPTAMSWEASNFPTKVLLSNLVDAKDRTHNLMPAKPMVYFRAVREIRPKPQASRMSCSRPSQHPDKCSSCPIVSFHLSTKLCLCQLIFMNAASHAN